MQHLDLVSPVLDFALMVAAIAAFLARPRIGGELAGGLRILLVGVIVLGFAHLLETASFYWLGLSLVTNEIAHRLFVGLGFVFIIVGFVTMRRAFES